MGLSVGLDTAVKALRAHQLAVDVAAHNIANAQTPASAGSASSSAPSASMEATTSPAITSSAVPVTASMPRT